MPRGVGNECPQNGHHIRQQEYTRKIRQNQTNTTKIHLHIQSTDTQAVRADG